jgi:DNA-directed RNA polymerase specialized sigma24 family protein
VPINSKDTKSSWALTKGSFDALLARLDPDRDRAGERYEGLRQRLLRIFEVRGCAGGEDLVDETLDRVTRRLEEGEQILDLSAYIGGVARLVAREAWRRQTKVAGEEEAPAAAAVVEDDDDEQIAECFDRCLASLPDESRQLILQYYRGERREKIDERQAMADNYGIPLNALRNRAHRIREKLEACISTCLGNEMKRRNSHSESRGKRKSTEP